MSARRVDPALLVVLGGVAAALHVGKLPIALPVLREALGVTLVQAGFLLSLVQVAGMLFGLMIGLAADSLGLKRTMVAGLALLSLASAVAGATPSVPALMLLRALEGMGFLMAATSAPSLIRRLVAPGRVNAVLGVWGAYMPLGTALALLCGAPVMSWVGWPGWWWLLAAMSALAALWIWVALPVDPRLFGTGQGAAAGWVSRLARTLRSPGPWLIALSFAVYSGQWLSVIGFLPSMYAQAGWSASLAGAATALAALVNMLGNIAAGRLLQRHARPQRLLVAGFAAMALGALIAFADVWGGVDARLAAAVRYAGVLGFSMVGGLIPGTLFSLAVRLAPGEQTVSTTVGWMQQWSSAGQFAGPPLVALVASWAGGWQWSGVVTGCLALAGMLLARVIGGLLARTSR
ncbi:MFS transporter [Ramlibacter solisilvae]|uniref:MFS transporter n=1 Tax=Ramlibacter tataouinensis TaxID=94132 RepID=A0A127K054_9BURK|nr:MFS transporter [Ramlibacter tataouinensis]AMO23782.1 MFS transporter [Ramlibacter tataouinensis]